MSYHAGAKARLSQNTTKTIDAGDRMDRVELEELRFDGWQLQGVKERVSRAGNAYWSYQFIRVTEPERRTA
jgi:hypothetical protein